MKRLMWRETLARIREVCVVATHELTNNSWGHFLIIITFLTSCSHKPTLPEQMEVFQKVKSAMETEKKKHLCFDGKGVRCVP